MHMWSVCSLYISSMHKILVAHVICLLVHGCTSPHIITSSSVVRLGLHQCLETVRVKFSTLTPIAVTQTVAYFGNDFFCYHYLISAVRDAVTDNESMLCI